MTMVIACSFLYDPAPRGPIPVTATAGQCAELRANTATTTRPVAAPISPSTSRSIPPVSPGTYNVATRITDTAAWMLITARPTSNTATDVASATTTASCQGPVPAAEISRAPAPTPALAPTISSTARRSRWPRVISMPTMTATGANSGGAVPEEMHGDEPGEAGGQGRLDQRDGNASPTTHSPRKVPAKARPGRRSHQHTVGTGRTPSRFPVGCDETFFELS